MTNSPMITGSEILYRSGWHHLSIIEMTESEKPLKVVWIARDFSLVHENILNHTILCTQIFAN